jgi:hypothetical protein
VVFETLNSRGKDLTAADLIKNNIFSQASEEEILEEVSDIWDKISNNLSNYSITLFIKYYLTMLYGEPIREKDLFKKVKRYILDNDLKKFLVELEEASEMYLSLLDPENKWEGYNEIVEILNNIKIMGLKTCYPFLLAVGLSNLNNTEKKDLYQEIENLGFRYNIIMNNSPNIMEIKYAEWAEKLKKNLFQLSDLKNEISKIKPNDNDFYSAFLNKQIHNNKHSKYILRKIGACIHGNDLLEVTQNATVEHIIPQKPSEKWKEYIKANNELKINGEDVSLKEFLDYIINSIGNQTLLLSDDNSKIGNNLFEQKAKEYSKSNLDLNKKIGQEKQWTLKEINKYQKQYAESAIKIW